MGRSTATGRDLPLSWMAGSGSKSSRWRAALAVSSSHSTPEPAARIRRAARFMPSPMIAQSRRSGLPRTPQKTRPVATPMAGLRPSALSSRAIDSAASMPRRASSSCSTDGRPQAAISTAPGPSATSWCSMPSYRAMLASTARIAACAWSSCGGAAKSMSPKDANSTVTRRNSANQSPPDASRWRRMRGSSRCGAAAGNGATANPGV